MSETITPAAVKSALREAGFTVYRTETDAVSVAERVRENLIMDAGIRVGFGGPRPSVLVRARAQRSDFTGEADEQLFARARALTAPAVARGYVERCAFVTQMPDPGDPSKSLDAHCQVELEKTVGDLNDAMAEVAFALALPRVAPT